MSHHILLTHWLTGFLIYAVRNVMDVSWLTGSLIYAARNTIDVQYISLPTDAVRSDSRLLRQVYEGTDFASLKMCGYNGRKWLLRQWF